MTIVTNRPPERRKATAPPAALAVPRIVQHTPKGKSGRLTELKFDVEVDAWVYEFFGRMGIKKRERGLT